MSYPAPTPRSFSAKEKKEKKVHPGTLATGLLKQAQDLVTGVREHAPISVNLPAQDIVSTGNVGDVIDLMTKHAPKLGLRVLYYTPGEAIWLKKA